MLAASLPFPSLQLTILRARLSEAITLIGTRSPTPALITTPQHPHGPAPACNNPVPAQRYGPPHALPQLNHPRHVHALTRSHGLLTLRQMAGRTVAQYPVQPPHVRTPAQPGFPNQLVLAAEPTAPPVTTTRLTAAPAARTARRGRLRLRQTFGDCLRSLVRHRGHRYRSTTLKIPFSFMNHRPSRQAP